MILLFKKVILLFGFLYIMITIFFNLPKNYLKITNSKYEAYFHFFLFQRWNFFAPPPNYNERLYYTFKNDNESSLFVYEVFEPLFKLKSEKAPFNNREDILDYLLSNSLNSMSEEINEANEYKRFLLETNQLKKDTVTLDLIGADIENSANFKTLYNYGKLLAENKLPGKQIDSVKITISRIFLPKFVDRNKIDSLLNEEIYYQSNYKALN